MKVNVNLEYELQDKDLLEFLEFNFDSLSSSIWSANLLYIELSFEKEKEQFQEQIAAKALSEFLQTDYWQRKDIVSYSLGRSIYSIFEMLYKQSMTRYSAFEILIDVNSKKAMHSWLKSLLSTYLQFDFKKSILLGWDNKNDINPQIIMQFIGFLELTEGELNLTDLMKRIKQGQDLNDTLLVDFEQFNEKPHQQEAGMKFAEQVETNAKL